MKRILIAALIVIAATCATALCQSTSNQTSTDAGTDHEVRKINDELADALMNSDTAVLDRILANNFSVEGTPPAPPRSKAEFIADLKSGEIKYESIDAGDVTYKSLGNTVVAAGEVKYKMKWRNQEYSFRRRVFVVFAKAERWQVLTLIAIDFRN